MGRKVHPVGFRIGTVKDWKAKWHTDGKHFVDYLQEDIKLRKAVADKYADASVSTVEIERQANKVSVTIHTARPGIVIGRGGQRVDEMRRILEGIIGKRIQLNVLEVAQPELDAFLVARSVAEQIERRIAYRRAMKQSMFRTIQAGAQGIKICCSGRLGGVEIARRQVMHQGRVPLHTIRADIDYGCTQAHINMGRIGVKVWIYRGDILPERKGEEAEEAFAEPIIAEAAVETAPEAKVEAVKAEPVAEEKPAAKPKAKKAVKAEAEPAAEEKAAKPKAKKTAKVEEEAEEKPAAKSKAKKAVKAKKETKQGEIEDATTQEG